MRVVLIFISLFFVACGGGAGSNNTTTVNNINYKATAKFYLANNLYDKALLDFKPNNNPSEYSKKIGFSNNWNQGFLGGLITIAVLDSGTNDDSLLSFNEHYKYKENKYPYWHDLSYRLDKNNFISYQYKRPYLVDANSNIELHGSKVMATASFLAKDLRFANILIPVLNSNEQSLNSIDEVDSIASVDALANQGVRFFNRSFSSVEKSINHTELNTGEYYPAIMYKNALVISAAGNTQTLGDVSPHALANDSPLKKGWIIALGYLGQKPVEYKDIYYIFDETKKYVYSIGNTCKKYGWDDCLAAPYHINGNFGTSFSAPIITSVAALIYEKYPWMSNDNIKESLFTTAFKVYGADEDDIKAHFGAGILNANKALNGVSSFRHDFYADVNIDNLYVFSNDISGDFGLIKDGVGTLALTGANTFTGDINIKKGTLWLNNTNKAKVINNSILRSTNASVKELYNNGIFINEGISLDNLYLGKYSLIYTNIGDLISVNNKASLAGDLRLVGVKYSYTLKDTNTLISAKEIENKFDNIYSNSPFLKIKNINYTANRVDVSVEKIDDLSTLPEINYYAKKNYESLFSYFDRLAYEQNDFVPSNDLAYNESNLNGGITPSIVANAIVNIDKNNLSDFSKYLFADDIYTNSLLNIARIKHINLLNNSFAFNYSHIDNLKENSVDSKISFAKDNASFGFYYNNANIYSNNFKNSANTYGFSLGYGFEIDGIYNRNFISYFEIENNIKRFDIYDNFKNKAFLISSEIGNEFLYARINYLNYKQDAFKEQNSLLDLEFLDFSKDIYFANLGVKYKYLKNNFSFNSLFDYEYNFNKAYKFKAKYQDVILDISSDFYKKSLYNFGLGLNYAKKNFTISLDYLNTFAKKYLTNKISLGFKYEL